MKVLVILKYPDKEIRTYLYISNTSWGYGEYTPFEELVKKTLDEVIKEYEKIDSAYSICYPTLEEVLRGAIRSEEYASQYCADLAYEILQEVRRRLGLDK